MGWVGPHAVLGQTMPLPNIQVRNVRRVFDNGEHNAFTDLIAFRDQYFLTFRSCPAGHGISTTATVIVLASKRGVHWQQVCQFGIPKRDPRDPHFLVFRDQLFLYTGTWFAARENDYDLNEHLGYAVSTSDGVTWTDPQLLEGTLGHYVWRAACRGNKAYLCGRRKIGFEVGPKNEGKGVASAMLESDDGLVWRFRSQFQDIDGDETAFVVERDGRVVAIARRFGRTAELCQSQLAEGLWARNELGESIGGPLLVRWGRHYLVGGRRQTVHGPRTALWWLTDGRLAHIVDLPSGGDNSYPGFAQLDEDRALLSWYSSHEQGRDGKTRTAIYLAELAKTDH